MAKCLQEEEKLPVCVQGYPVLYNMAEPSFLNKSEKQNALRRNPWWVATRVMEGRKIGIHFTQIKL